MLSYIGYCAYSPSKYAVKGLADGLRMELQRCNIRVGCIYPPNMDTPCLKKENETKPEEGLYCPSSARWQRDTEASGVPVLFRGHRSESHPAHQAR